MKKYEEIAIKIHTRIQEDEFNETKKLPTERQLMKEYNVSKNTIRSAINVLIKKGLLFSIHGSGVYIRPTREKGTINLSYARSFALQHPGDIMDREVLTFDIIACDTSLAKKLECDLGIFVYYIKRIMYIDHIPFVIEYTYYNKEIIPYLNEDIAKSSIFTFITKDLKLNVGFSEKYISTTPLSDEDRKLLNLEKGAFGLVVEDNTYLSSGKKFNYSNLWYNYKYANLFNSDK